MVILVGDPAEPDADAAREGDTAGEADAVPREALPRRRRAQRAVPRSHQLHLQVSEAGSRLAGFTLVSIKPDNHCPKSFPFFRG